VLPDHPAVFEAWEIERQTLAGGAELASPIIERAESIKRGVATIRLKRSLPDGRPIVCIYRLRPASPVLELEYQIDWQMNQTLLKLAFDTEYLGRRARFGAPYGSAPRPQLSSTLANDAMFEVPGSRWAAVSDDGEVDGLMLVTESKYGFGACDGTLHLSLLRNASHTNHDHGPQRWTDPGQHTIRLAVGRFSADSPRECQPASLADTLFTAPIAYSGDAIAGPIDDVLHAPTLIPAWAKPESDGSAVLRLHETLGRRGVARLALRSGVRAERIDLRGLPTRADSLAGDRLTFGPYELISLRLRR
jgi:alpha-mannosidase